MNNIQSKYYRSGVTGVNYLIINRSMYTHSELLPDNTIRVIKCNIEEKEMNVIEKKKNDEEWKELDSNQIQHGVVIDLNDLGDRWEGSCVNGSTYGFGCLYNSDNRKIYSGFMYDGMKVCYGSEFYGDCGAVEYVGGFFQNCRHGYGKLYSKKNELVYEGEWCNNIPFKEKSIVINISFFQNDIHFGLEEILIGDNCISNMEYFKLIEYSSLKRLFIGNNCFQEVDEIVIDNCNELEGVYIGGNCMSGKNLIVDDDNMGILSIKNCMKLQLFSVNEGSLGNIINCFEFHSIICLQ